MMKDRIPFTTKLIIDDEDWEVVDQVTGDGLSSAASILGSPANDSWMPFIAIGSGITAPSSEDKVLENEIHRKRGTVTVVGNTYFVEADFGVDEPTEDCMIREVGIFDAISGGRLGARWLLLNEIIKEFNDTISICCAISLT